MAFSEISTTEALLSEGIDSGFVDHKGRPINRLKSGGWRAASFILGVEVAERFAYYGISSNLITYLTGQLGQSTATAAETVNVWMGTASLLPLLGAFVADSFLGRYSTVVVASLIYILGLGLMTLSALLTLQSSSDCQSNNTIKSCSPPLFQLIMFILYLYLVAIGQGCHKPCTQAFGADQFDAQNPQECKAKSSFFNWWFFAISIGANSTTLVVIYIQDNLNWALGFGVPWAVMVAGLVLFLLGTKKYRYCVKTNSENPFARVARVFVVAVKNRKATLLASEAESQGSQQFKFLNKALLSTSEGSMEDGKLCKVDDVEEAKTLLRLIPIWTTCLVYAIAYTQYTTFFIKQGAIMDRTIIRGIEIPAASLQLFIGIGVIIFIPIYDRIFIPITRNFTQNPSGITRLQRIGFGIFLLAITMVVAASVEMKRLETAKEYGLIDKPNVTIPMSVWWLVPQYLLCGISDVFTIVGMQEFFYDQMPKELKSIGLSIYFSVLGVGGLLSGILVSIINEATSGDGRDSWFADNINRAHIDYFYWLLAGLNAAGLLAFVYFAKSYVYKFRG